MSLVGCAHDMLFCIYVAAAVAVLAASINAAPIEECKLAAVIGCFKFNSVYYSVSLHCMFLLNESD